MCHYLRDNVKTKLYSSIHSFYILIYINHFIQNYLQKYVMLLFNFLFGEIKLEHVYRFYCNTILKSSKF
jgi:hypothetical protein